MGSAYRGGLPPRTGGSVALAEDRDEMKILALVRMAERHFLVQLDAKARGCGRNDVAILPLDRLFQDLAMETAPGLDALEDQEIGTTGADLDVGRTHDGPAIEVRGDLGVVGLGHAGDLLGLEKAADPAQIHLQDRGSSGPEYAGEFVFGGETFARRDGDAGAPRDLGHLLGHLGRD